MKVNNGLSYFTFAPHNKTGEIVSLGIKEHFINPDFNYGEFALISNQIKERITGSIQDLLNAITKIESLRIHFMTLSIDSFMLLKFDLKQRPRQRPTQGISTLYICQANTARISVVLHSEILNMVTLV